MKRRIFTLMLALCMAVSCTASAETVKHERVFAVTDGMGTVRTLIDSVRLENGDGLDEIIDRTMLQNVENVGGDEAFTTEGDLLIWQANGESITYQGTADQSLHVTPVVAITLDGEEAALDDVRNGSGEMTLTVDYQMAAGIPYLAVSVLPLDVEHMRDVVISNGTVVNEGAGSVAIGWAVPGADESLELPSGFTLTAQVDHADLSFMMTVATAQPLDVLCTEAAPHIDDLRDEVADIIDGLTALRDGTEMADGEGELREGLAAMLTLFDGADTLDEGAETISNGADNLDDGAASLETGLSALAENNEALNQGAAQLFAAVLDTANTQLAAAGLEAAGITLPALTAENYADALQAAMDQIDPETLTAMATEAAREQVRAEVMKREEAVRQGVSQAVEAQVMEGVLASAGLSITAEDYAAAVKAGRVEEAQAKQIHAAVEQMMASEEVKAQMEEAVADQIDKLVEENVASKAVQTQIEEGVAPAKAAWESLSGLKSQLDAVNAFVTGLGDYTNGVAQAATGASTLHEGTSQLISGAAQLKEGTGALKEGLEKLKSTLTGDVLDLMTDDVQKAIEIFDSTADQLDNGMNFDLVAESMAHDLVFIIRTDLKN